MDRYVDEWTRSITDVTARVRDVHAALRAGRDVTGLLPAERPYPLPPALARTVAATPT